MRNYGWLVFGMAIGGSVTGMLLNADYVRTVNQEVRQRMDNERLQADAERQFKAKPIIADVEDDCDGRVIVGLGERQSRRMPKYSNPVVHTAVVSPSPYYMPPFFSIGEDRNAIQWMVLKHELERIIQQLRAEEGPMPREVKREHQKLTVDGYRTSLLQANTTAKLFHPALSQIWSRIDICYRKDLKED